MHSQKSVEKADRIFEITHFLGLGLFPNESLFWSVAHIVSSLPVWAFVGKDIHSAASGSSEHGARASQIDTERALHVDILIY